MFRRSFGRNRGVWVCVAAVLAVSAPTVARSQTTEEFGTVGPDLLQTLGVGSRSVAMGNAYSAIADDPSATFWNPGRLGVLARRQMMLHFRPGLETTSNVSWYRPTLGDPETFSQTLKRKAGGLQPTFASFVYPLTDQRSGGAGTLGVSYTLGGYFNLDATRIRTVGAITDPTTFAQTFDHDWQLMRNSYLTVAYGHQWSPLRNRVGTLGAGIAYYRVTADFQSEHQTKTTAWDDTLNQQVTSITDTQRIDRGNGDGVVAGVYYQTGIPSQPGLEDAPPGPDGKPLSVSSTTWSFAACYRSGATLGGMGFGASTVSEIPDRLSLGVAYTSYLPTSEATSASRDRVVVATEVQRFSKANSPEQTDFRKEVTNFHLGVEWIPAKPLIAVPKERRYETPIRLGFRTNQSAVRYAYSENVLSGGFAFVRKGENDAKVLTIEPTVEYFTKSKVWFVNLTFQMALDAVVRTAGGEDRPATEGR
ncbi:MAG: hypothetical protein GX446_12800 [Chthonomonadales bacterium]|nr:hypothetical protein [Chthonomonadales bacterium]